MNDPLDIEEAIRVLHDEGYGIICPRDRDEELAANWRGALMEFRIAHDRVKAGAVLRLDMAPQGYDPRPFLRDGLVRMIDGILATATWPKEGK